MDNICTLVSEESWLQPRPRFPKRSQLSLLVRYWNQIVDSLQKMRQLRIQYQTCAYRMVDRGSRKWRCVFWKVGVNEDKRVLRVVNHYIADSCCLAEPFLIREVIGWVSEWGQYGYETCCNFAPSESLNRKSNYAVVKESARRSSDRFILYKLSFCWFSYRQWKMKYHPLLSKEACFRCVDFTWSSGGLCRSGVWKCQNFRSPEIEGQWNEYW